MKTLNSAKMDQNTREKKNLKKNPCMDLCYAFIESGKVRHTNEPDYFHISIFTCNLSSSFMWFDPQQRGWEKTNQWIQ